MFSALVVLQLLFAQPSDASGSAARSAEAKRLKQNADRARDLGRYDEAIDQLKNAYQQTGDPALLIDLGEVHLDAGHNAEAAHFYKVYLQRDPQRRYRDAAERLRIKLEARNGNESTAPPVAAPVAPAPATRTPETRTVTAAPASPPPAADVPPPAQPSPPASSPPASAPPPAAPASASAVPPLDRNAGLPPHVAPAGSAANGAAAAPAALAGTVETRSSSNQPPLPAWLPWAGVGLTAALVGGAVVSGLRASSRYDELRDTCGRTAQRCTENEIDSVQSRALLTNVLWGAAGLVAVATGVAFYVNQDGGGVAAGGTF